jgi:hypothetical protein
MKKCKTCNKKKTGSRKNECEACAYKRRKKTDPIFFLRQLYHHFKARCVNPNGTSAKYYYGKKYCEVQEFIDYFKNDSQFKKLYKAWQKSGFVYKITPSINRIDKNSHYLLKNLEFITHSKNAGIDKEKLPILMYDLDGNFIREFESKWQAHQILGIPNGNLCKVCYGKRKSAGGYVFKFKNT